MNTKWTCPRCHGDKPSTESLCDRCALNTTRLLLASVTPTALPELCTYCKAVSPDLTYHVMSRCTCEEA